MKIDAIIVDDEADSRSVLQKLLTNFCPSINVVAEAADIQKGFELINSLKPSVVFLDIQMPGGNGFMLLKKFEKIFFDTVFVTSYDKYALEAIKLSALHYLLKPIEVKDLLEAVDRIEKNAYKKQVINSQIANAIGNSEGIQKKITIHMQDKVLFLSLHEITHLESERNYTVIFTTNGKKYTSSKNLGEYEEMFKEQEVFYRINKSCIVNLNHISNYTKDEPCILTINGKNKQEVSRRKKQELLELLKFKK